MYILYIHIYTYIYIYIYIYINMALLKLHCTYSKYGIIIIG